MASGPSRRQRSRPALWWVAHPQEWARPARPTSPLPGDALLVTSPDDGHDDDATRSTGAVAEQGLCAIAAPCRSARRAGLRRGVRVPCPRQLLAASDLYPSSQRAWLSGGAAVVAASRPHGGGPA